MFSALSLSTAAFSRIKQGALLCLVSITVLLALSRCALQSELAEAQSELGAAKLSLEQTVIALSESEADKQALKRQSKDDLELVVKAWESQRQANSVTQQKVVEFETVYKTNTAVADWADTPIPDDVMQLLKQSSDHLSHQD